MIILGIDPGLAIVGYGVIEAQKGAFRPIDCGVINTPKSDTVPIRLNKIYDGMLSLIEKYKPDCIAIEELFFNTNITTGINVAQARGVVLLACQQKGLKMYEYTPLQIKQALTGYGKAEKKQIQFMVARLLNLKAVPKPDDAADGLAVALTHGQTARMGGLFGIR
ncbi:MAG: crossover junction endodeoxyribonuclease RuvC [Clostridia bacterium]|jgi:crossover junction endodeoxyribonuclease RuvC|nr:crossover junction endodeoxyribonuclease RuvC [Clostridia bacterium]MCI8944187.1 crossover junction endodeoxyribonuclease RuvC [Clostridia bacterium]